MNCPQTLGLPWQKVLQQDVLSLRVAACLPVYVHGPWPKKKSPLGEQDGGPLVRMRTVLVDLA